MAGVENFAPSKDQKELLRFYTKQRDLRYKSMLKDKMIECFTKIMEKPAQTLY